MTDIKTKNVNAENADKKTLSSMGESEKVHQVAAEAHVESAKEHHEKAIV